MTKDKDLHPIHPGEILREELLKAYQITPRQLAQSIKVKESIIEELVKEKINITPELSYRLGLYWGVREDYWLDLQKHYELECWKREAKEEKIKAEVFSHRMIFHSIIWKLDPAEFGEIMDNVLSQGK